MARAKNSEFYIRFGEFVRKAREDKGLTQIDMANACGLTQSFYSKVERGDREVSFENALRICVELNLNMKDFIREYL